MLRDQTEGIDGQEGVVADGVGAVGAAFGGVRAVAAVLVVLAQADSEQQAPTDRPTRSPPSSKPVIMLNAQSA